MRVLNISGLSLQCDADQVTAGDALEQARQAVEMVNLELQRQPYGLGAQIMLGASSLSAEFEQQDEMEDDSDGIEASDDDGPARSTEAS